MEGWKTAPPLEPAANRGTGCHLVLTLWVRSVPTNTRQPFNPPHHKERVIGLKVLESEVMLTQLCVFEN